MFILTVYFCVFISFSLLLFFKDQRRNTNAPQQLQVARAAAGPPAPMPMRGPPASRAGNKENSRPLSHRNSSVAETAAVQVRTWVLEQMYFIVLSFPPPPFHSHISPPHPSRSPWKKILSAMSCLRTNPRVRPGLSVSEQKKRKMLQNSNFVHISGCCTTAEFQKHQCLSGNEHKSQLLWR